MDRSGTQRKRDRVKGLFSRSKRSSLSSGPVLTSGQTAGNAPAKDLWSRALQRLSDEEQRMVLQHCPSIPTTLASMPDMLRHIHTVTEEKRALCDEKAWKFELDGRQVILRDVAEKVITGINRFKAVGDVAANFDPAHFSLPWAGVRFLLEATVAEREQMAALLIGVDKMAYLTNRCTVYEFLYLRDPQVRQAMQNLESAMEALYVVTLRFFANAIRLYDKSTGARALHAILNPGKISDFIKECQTLEQRVDIEAGNCERTCARTRRAELNDGVNRLKRLLEELREPMMRVDSRVFNLWDRSNQSVHVDILRWASDIPYEEVHSFASEGRTESTGEWLLRHHRYREWQASSASMILWLHGIPGAGKTKLASKVIDNLRHLHESCSDHEALAYFYCDRNQDDRREPVSILRSFIRQLSTTRSGDALLPPLLQFYTQKRQTGFSSGKPTTKESEGLLRQLVEIYPQTTLVLDALDECDRRAQTQLTEILDSLVDKSVKPVKIFISSRPDPDIKYRFGTGPNVEIQATDNQDDIGRFVSAEIDKDDKRRRQKLSASLREEIIETLLAKSQGMFQWASLQIDQLLKLERERDIRDRLGKLPKDLERAYDEIYEKIRTQDGSGPQVAERAFQWIMCSCRPLSISELVAAVCQNPDASTLQHVDIGTDFVLGACHNLLAVDPKLGIWRFSHLSVQEYLERRCWSPSQANGLVAKVCLLLLNDAVKLEQISHSENEQGEIIQRNVQSMEISAREMSGMRDLMRYAINSWPKHIQNHGEEDIDNGLAASLMEFLGSMDQSGPAYQRWYEVIHANYEYYLYDIDLYDIHRELEPASIATFAVSLFGLDKIVSDWWDSWMPDTGRRNTRGHSLLQLAACGGSVAVVTNLLRSGADVNAQGGGYGSALQAAAARGNWAVVKLLLNEGADMNAQGGELGSALQAAAAWGHEVVVRLLLEQGADVHARDGRFGSALQAAATWGHEVVVRLLLEQGADVNAQGGKYGSALQAAAYRGREEMVRLLLEHGEDVNAQGGKYGSALQAAAYSGSKAVARLLLEQGADMNVQGGVYGSALQAAATWGDEVVMWLLLQQGADVDATGGQYGSALQAAAYSGSEAAVRLLLERGADVNVQGGVYGSALQAAATWGHEVVVRLLLEQGADVNLQGGEYGSALQAAATSGEAIVRLLLEHGADVNALGGKYGSVLQAAAYWGREDVVRLLLEHEADVNAHGGKYGNAFQGVALDNKGTVLRLLLEQGANVNAQGGKYGSALQAAAYDGREAIVRLLLEQGADVNVQGGEYGSALQAAATKGSQAMVKLLLDEGADVNAQGGEYSSALQAAAYWGYEAIMRLLLEQGADVNAPGGEFGSALQAAAACGHEMVVRLLLEQGADVNAQEGKYGSALQAAMMADSDEIEPVVRLLLEHGADVNALGGEHGSALQAAASNGHEKLVQLLLEKGADVNAQGGRYGSALQASVAKEKQAVVKLLLDKGADVNATGGKYGSALQAATHRDNKALVRLLLDQGADVNAQNGESGSALQTEEV